MTPRLPLVTAALVTAALVAATLATPASAVTVEAGTWTSGNGMFAEGMGGMDGEVTWANLTTSTCWGWHRSGTGTLSCTGAVTFEADCIGQGLWGTLVAFECYDTARHVYATAEVAITGPSGSTIAGTITYKRL